MGLARHQFLHFRLCMLKHYFQLSTIFLQSTLCKALGIIAEDCPNQGLLLHMIESCVTDMIAPLLRTVQSSLRQVLRSPNGNIIDSSLLALRNISKNLSRENGGVQLALVKLLSDSAILNYTENYTDKIIFKSSVIVEASKMRESDKSARSVEALVTRYQVSIIAHFRNLVSLMQKLADKSEQKEHIELKYEQVYKSAMKRLRFLVHPTHGILMRIMHEGKHNSAVKLETLKLIRDFFSLPRSVYLSEDDVYIDSYIRYHYFAFIKLYLRPQEEGVKDLVCCAHLEILLAFSKHQVRFIDTTFLRIFLGILLENVNRVSPSGFLHIFLGILLENVNRVSLSLNSSLQNCETCPRHCP